MRTILILFTLSLCAYAADTLRIAEQAMQVKQFDKAVRLLDEHLSADEALQKIITRSNHIPSWQEPL